MKIRAFIMRAVASVFLVVMAAGLLNITAAYAKAADMDTQTASSNDKIGLGAQNFVDSMASRALDFLANDKLSKEQKRSAFAKILYDSFDMDTIGRFSLGPYWRASTEAQRDQYLKLFRKMIIDVYSARFQEYKGQKFKTTGFHRDGDKDTIVTSSVVPADGPEVQVEWRVRYKQGRYQVVDVIVEGVSMSVTQRSDFSSVIQRGGGNVEVLLAYLSGNHDQQKN